MRFYSLSPGQSDPSGVTETVCQSAAGGPAERLHRQPHRQLRLEQQRGLFPLSLERRAREREREREARITLLLTLIDLPSCLEDRSTMRAIDGASRYMQACDLTLLLPSHLLTYFTLGVNLTPAIKSPENY